MEIVANQKDPIACVNIVRNKMVNSRHQARIKIIQNLFSWEFVKKNLNELPYITETKTKEIIKKIDKIDLLIKKYAPRYPLEEISKVDLAILRWAVYEIIFDKKLPYKVVIDEAVELAKELSSENGYRFVNGVLGSLIKDYHYESQEKSL